MSDKKKKVDVRKVVPPGYTRWYERTVTGTDRRRFRFDE